MRVLLVFPPQWTTAQPHFAVGALAGQLRRAGHEVVARDLNLELLEHALSERGLAGASKRLVAEARLLTGELAARSLAGDGGLQVETARRLSGLEAFMERRRDELPALKSAAPGALAELRNPDAYYDPVRYVAAHGLVDGALELFSASSYPTTMAWNDFRHPTAAWDLAPIEALTRDRRLNPVLRFAEEQLPGLLAHGAGLVAISINSFSQVVPGLTVARVLRGAARELPEGSRPHVTLGGNFFSRLRESLAGKPAFFEVFADSLCIGEGERTVVELAGAVERGGLAALEEVGNLLYLSGGKVKATLPKPNDAMRTLAFQDFGGLPLERYLAPERVFCLRASKGCYWGQCSFCDSYHGLEPDSVAVERVVAEMRHLRDTFGVRHFEFVDQCIAPAYLSALSDALIAAELGVHWFFNARTEPGFTPELLQRVKRAGATMILWGMESGSPRLLKLMKKGVQAEKRLEILRAASDAGLFNFAYVFFGFPTETEAEAQQTIDLIRHNTDIIHGYGRSVFTLGKHSPLAKDPQRYGILSVVEDVQDLSTNLRHEVAEGLGPDGVMAVAERCFSQCKEAYGGEPLWMALRSREALHLYLARRGLDFVRGFRFGQAAAAAEAGFVF